MNNEFKCVAIVISWTVFSFILWMSGYYHKSIIVPVIYTFASYMVVMKTFEIIKRGD